MKNGFLIVSLLKGETNISALLSYAIFIFMYVLKYIVKRQTGREILGIT